MKIAIVSDMHLGYDRFEEDAFSQAKEALEEASRAADAVLIPGDVFDKRYPRPEVIAQAINLFRELSKKRWGASIVEFRGASRIFTTVPIVAIPGTHERTAEGRDNALKLLSLAGLLADTSEATTVLQKGNEKVAVFGLGGLAEEMVRERLKGLGAAPEKGAFSIFMFHQSVYELLPFSEHFIRLDELPKGFDLYVCGHIHSRAETTAHGKKLLIPGSTVITQLKDQEQERKGFILLDTSDGSHKFVHINSRPFISRTIHVDGAKPSDIVEKCEAELSAILKGASGKPIVKLKVEGAIAEGFAGSDIPVRSLLAKYSGKAYLAVDSSKLVAPGMAAKMEELRDGRIGDMPIRELGTLTFVAKLKELGMDRSIDVNELLAILSAQGSKEKVLKAANELLFGEQR